MIYLLCTVLFVPQIPEIPSSSWEGGIEKLEATKICDGKARLMAMLAVSIYYMSITVIFAHASSWFSFLGQKRVETHGGRKRDE
jgi:hypothetical protein